MKKWLLFLFTICLLKCNASFDKASPACKALQTGTFPIEIFHVIIGWGSLSDLQAWLLVSNEAHMLALDALSRKYGRFKMPRKIVVPNLSKMLRALKDDSTDTGLHNFIKSVDTRLFSSLEQLGNICLLDPLSVFANPKAVSALPFIISEHGKGNFKEILMQLIESRVYEDIARQIIPFVEEELCESDVFKAITCGISCDTVKALVAGMKPEMASECVLLGYKIFNDGACPEKILESLMALKNIPTPLLCLLAETKYEDILLQLVDARDDIIVTGYQFWFKLGKLDLGKSIAKSLLGKKENHIGAMMLLDPDSIHDLLSSANQESFKVAPLLVSVFLGTKRHHGALLRFLAGRTFTTTEAFEIAALSGANDVVLHKIFHITMCTPLQIYLSIPKLVGIPAVTPFIKLWIHQLTPLWTLKTLQNVIESRDQSKIEALVDIICCISSWHLNHSIRFLELVYKFPKCRAALLDIIEARMKESKMDIIDKVDSASSVLSHALSYIDGESTFGSLFDVRALLFKVLSLEAILDCCKESHLTTEATVEALQFLPAYLHPILTADSFKAMAKKTWRHFTLTGIRFCMDFFVPPSDIEFLLSQLKPKRLLLVVLYAVEKERVAYIEYFGRIHKLRKKMKIMRQYIANYPDFNVQTFMRLDSAFNLVGQDSRSLLHACLCKSIPEPVIRHIVSKYHIIRRLSADVVYGAALNPAYSDDLIALLICHCQFEPFAGRLLKRMDEGRVWRGDEFVELIRQMAHEAYRLPTCLSPRRP